MGKLTVEITDSAGVSRELTLDHAEALLVRDKALDKNRFHVSDPNYKFVDGKLIRAERKKFSKGKEKR